MMLTCLRAVAQGTRMEVLRRLLAGPKRVNDLAKDMDVTSGTVSRHLATLAAGGWVCFEQLGAQSWYSVAEAARQDWRAGVLEGLAAVSRASDEPLAPALPTGRPRRRARGSPGRSSRRFPPRLP